MTQTDQPSLAKKSTLMHNIMLACIMSSISLPLISSAQMTPSEPVPASKATVHSNAMTEGKDMTIKKSMEGMQQKMASMSMSGNTDHDFAMMMKEHHQGAIDMAEIELKQGNDPQLKKMASKIIAAQKKEMAEFDSWLKKHEAGMSSSPTGR